MLRKVISLFVVSMLLCLSAQSAFAKDISLKLSHHRPVDSQLDKDMKKFAADVAKATDNRITIEVFPAGQLGGSYAAMERVSMGAIDMMIGDPNSELDPRLNIYSLPGILKDFNGVGKLFSKGAPYMAHLEKIFNDSDLHVLASYTTAFSGACFKKPPKDIKNPNAKHNEKIRVPGTDVHRYVAEAIGYMGTPLPWGEVFTALQTGVVDGVYGPGAEPIYTTLRDVITVCLFPNVQLDMFFLLINQDKFNSIPEQDRKIMMDIANKLEKSRFTVAAEEQKMWEKRLSEKKIEICKLTPDELTTFQKKIQEQVWPKLRKDLGEKFFDQTIEAWKASMK